MGGASKGRVVKKQRCTTITTTTTKPSTCAPSPSATVPFPFRSMRRGHTRRTNNQSRSPDVSRTAIEQMFNHFREQNGMSCLCI